LNKTAGLQRFPDERNPLLFKSKSFLGHKYAYSILLLPMIHQARLCEKRIKAYRYFELK
jgi:hypothetical protein